MCDSLMAITTLLVYRMVREVAVFGGLVRMQVLALYSLLSATRSRQRSIGPLK